MSFRPKLWLGVGAFALAGVANPAASDPAVPTDPTVSRSPVPAGSRSGSASGPVILAQARGLGGESGEAGEGGERGARNRAHAGDGRHGGLHRKKTRNSRSIRRAHGSGREGGEQGGERGRAPRSGLQGGERGVAGRFGPDGEGGERGGAGHEGSGRGRAGAGGEGGEGGVNTRYIFGFTEGADTERAGEKEFENDLIGRFAKRSAGARGGAGAGGEGGARGGTGRGGSSYTALQNKTELEYGVTDNLTFELGAFTSYYRVRNVPDLDDRNAANFDGLFAELKYRLLDRTIHPIGLAVSIEPEWHRFDEVGGKREDSYALELKLYADKELIPNRLYVAANLTYEPEAAHVRAFDPDTGRFTEWERESSFGASGAVSVALADRLFLGAELRYLAKYEGSFLNKLEGRALYIGPTLSARILPNALLQAAYSVQVDGRAADDPDRHLDLINFERHQARLRFVFEF